MSNWQPIETAPTNGSWILLFSPNGEWEEEWNNYEGRAVPTIWIAKWVAENVDWEDYYDGPSRPRGEPTHWMRLGALPPLRKSPEQDSGEALKRRLEARDSFIQMLNKTS